MVAILFHARKVSFNDRSTIDKCSTPSYTKVLQHCDELLCVFEKFCRV